MCYAIEGIILFLSLHYFIYSCDVSEAEVKLFFGDTFLSVPKTVFEETIEIID